MRLALLLNVGRQFSKDKVYSTINILGLAVGIASTGLIARFVDYELRYDRFYPQYREIYRVYTDGTWSGKSLRDGNTAYPLGEALQRDFPDVKEVTRCQSYHNRSIRLGEKHFYENKFFYADSNFINFFGYKILAGNPETMLEMPHSLVMTASVAEKYFGNEEPVGKAVRMENEFGNDTSVYNITGIIEDLPASSHLKIDMIASLSTYPSGYRQNNWLGGGFITYMRLNPLADPDQLTAKLEKAIPDYIASDLQKYLNMSKEDYLNSKNTYTFHFQPVSDIHMNGEINDGITVHGNAKQIYILACIAVFILILACVNFTNLSTAKATLRAKEIGIRKVSGASRRQIAVQFLGEVFLHVCAATLIGLILAVYLQVPFTRLMDRNITIISPDTRFISGLIIIMLFTTLVAGSYPAFLVSSMTPLDAIRGKVNRLHQRQSLRTALVLVQFILSVATAIAALTVYRQMVYLEKHDSGFNRSDVIVVERTDPLRGRVRPFLEELRKQPEVETISLSSGLFGRIMNQSALSREGKSPEELVFFHLSAVDFDFDKVYKLQLISGRWFSPEFADSNSVIINETAAKALGWDDPVGKRLFNPDGRRTSVTIIGVMKDFNYESLHTPVRPFLFTLNPTYYDGYVSIRLKPGDPQKSLAALQETWKAFVPDDPMVYYYYDQEFGRIYRTELAAKNIMLVFTVLAVIISCLGLLGMASYMAGRKTKEVGIRKSFGAGTYSIIALLSRYMIGIVLVANLIAWPLARIGINRWLDDFAYRIPQNFIIPVMVTAGALILCILTIAYHTIRLARSNPVDALRYE